MQELSNNISGFYYDKQLSNPTMTIALFPNTKLVGQDWVAVDDPDSEVYPPSSSGEVWKYSKTPIITAIANEDFNIAIANSWSEFGGDPIADIWNSQKPMAPYLLEAGKLFSKIAQTTASYDFSNSALGFLKDGSGPAKFANFFAKIGEMQEKQSSLLSRSLVVQGTRFSYYGGTGTDFGNLGMRFTVFAGYDEYGVWKSVWDQLKRLMEHSIGDFVDLNAGLGGEIDNFLNEFAKWQLPPGGFEAALKDIDTVQKGTLKLVIGSYYSITNLAVSNVQLSASKAMVKNPVKWSNGGTPEIEPAYCEVNLMLRPITKFSKKSLELFTYGRASTELQKKTNDDIAKGLN